MREWGWVQNRASASTSGRFPALVGGGVGVGGAGTEVHQVHDPSRGSPAPFRCGWLPGDPTPWISHIQGHRPVVTASSGLGLNTTVSLSKHRRPLGQPSKAEDSLAPQLLSTRQTGLTVGCLPREASQLGSEGLQSRVPCRPPPLSWDRPLPPPRASRKETWPRAPPLLLPRKHFPAPPRCEGSLDPPARQRGAGLRERNCSPFPPRPWGLGRSHPTHEEGIFAASCPPAAPTPAILGGVDAG